MWVFGGPKFWRTSAVPPFAPRIQRACFSTVDAVCGDCALVTWTGPADLRLDHRRQCFLFVTLKKVFSICPRRPCATTTLIALDLGYSTSTRSASSASSVHGDITPSNVMLDSSRAPRLARWLRHREARRPSSLTCFPRAIIVWA